MFIALILSRWLHVVSACLVIGALFFMQFLLSPALFPLDSESRQMVFLRSRRGFKMLLHTTILLLVVTGTVNLCVNLGKYNLNPALNHPILGMHLLLALIAFGLALYLLSGKQPPPTHRRLSLINLVVLLATVAAASTLKWAREKTVAEHPPTLLENR